MDIVQSWEWFLIIFSALVFVVIAAVISGWIQGKMVSLQFAHQETKITHAHARADDAFLHATKAHLKIDNHIAGSLHLHHREGQ